MNRSTPRLLTALTLGWLATGCAHQAPSALSSARAAYERAAHGAACDYDPGAVFLAGRSLQRAEREYDEHGDSEHAQSLAYVAMRKAERVAVLARAVQHEAAVEARAEAATATRVAQSAEPWSPDHKLARR